MQFRKKFFPRTFIIFIFIPLIRAVDECLDRPNSDSRQCTSHRLNSYNDKTEQERKLWTKTYVSTVLRCSNYCMNDQRCVSYFFNKSTKTCTGHSIMFGNSTAASVETGNAMYYFSGVEGYIGDLCTTDDDCTVVSSECRADCLNNTNANTSECSEKRCMCASGYSFSPTEHKCLANCTSYGEGFMRTYLHYISNGAGLDYANITLEQCQQHCVQRSSPICRSLVYGTKRLLDCYLLTTTRLDYPDIQWHYDSYTYEFSYYQRDCI
ncbi:uncharacterized protein LOC127702661 [Mytilus californianus]|uniref:uncharacterized protein LOC127702661 n=1 Tax=Mytilus californianus TaxID=6549 RepID=UPI002245F02F|nr:uncharacterized protein LOC127702661 [Mytilus californianus]